MKPAFVLTLTPSIDKNLDLVVDFDVCTPGKDPSGGGVVVEAQGLTGQSSEAMALTAIQQFLFRARQWRREQLESSGQRPRDAA